MLDLLVCITFDYDNVSSAIARGGVTPTLLSRGEFGLVGAERIPGLLRAEGVPSTWFIPGHTIESYPASAAAVRDAGCEIGHHGWTHRVTLVAWPQRRGGGAGPRHRVHHRPDRRGAAGRPPAGLGPQRALGRTAAQARVPV